MFQIILTARAKKELSKIKKDYKKNLNLVFEEISENPFVSKPLVRELFGKYSYKVGPYRVVYTINKKDKIVTILTAGHRSVIYV